MGNTTFKVDNMNNKDNRDNVKKLLITLVILLIMNIFCIQAALNFVGSTIEFDEEDTESTENIESTETIDGKSEKTSDNKKDTSRIYKDLNISVNEYNIDCSDDDAVFLCTTISDNDYVNILSKIYNSSNYIVIKIDRQGSCAYITFNYVDNKKDNSEKGSEESDNTKNINGTKESSKVNKDIKQ